MSATFIWNKNQYNSHQLLELQEVNDSLLDVQKVVKFWISNADLLPISTSGSTGTPAVWHHPRTRLEASARATLGYFNLMPGGTAALGIPANRIGGAMMIIRALVGELRLHLLEPKLALELPEEPIDFLPVTLPQYEQLSSKARAKAKNILLGGGAVPVMAMPEETTVYVGYGMTETASHVAVRRLDASLYEAIGSTRFSSSEAGALCIHSPHLGIDLLQTNDAVRLQDERSFTVEGRLDFVINSGGIKIQPEVGERELLKAGVSAVISYREDAVFGQLPILVLREKDALALAKAELVNWKKNTRPRHCFICAELPETVGGKLDRRALAAMIKSHPDRLFPIEAK